MCREIAQLSINPCHSRIKHPIVHPNRAPLCRQQNTLLYLATSTFPQLPRCIGSKSTQTPPPPSGKHRILLHRSIQRCLQRPWQNHVVRHRYRPLCGKRINYVSIVQYKYRYLNYGDSIANKSELFKHTCKKEKRIHLVSIVQ